MNRHTHRIMPILQAASEECGVAVNAIMSGKRDRDTTLARHLTMYIARTRLNWTYERIAVAMGGLDHRAVMAAVRKIDKLRSTSPRIGKVIPILFPTI